MITRFAAKFVLTVTLMASPESRNALPPEPKLKLAGVSAVPWDTTAVENVVDSVTPLPVIEIVEVCLDVYASAGLADNNPTARLVIPAIKRFIHNSSL